MKNSVKKIIKSIAITAVTLLSGFGITAVSFNLFGSMTANEMKILFAIDVVILLLVGAAFYCAEERKAKRAKKQKEFEQRHRQRVEQAFRQYDGMDMAKISAKGNNFAA